MRIQRLFLMLILMIFCLSAFTSAFYQQPKFSASFLKDQVYSSVQDTIGIPFEIVEEAPIFPGCEDSTNKRACFKRKVNEHIRANFNYPRAAFYKGIKGKVNIKITFDENGEISNVEYRSPHRILENEASRIIDLLPKMKPGRQDEKTVKVEFYSSINFVMK
ncbi:MAG: TonB family protein [Flavobacteriaceae bacterium]|nr:TonB family protein [Flavobacteriaceae bacterium]